MRLSFYFFFFGVLRMKLSKRIRNQNNYYLEMEEGDEVHITNREGYILLALTMTKEGLRKFSDQTI